MTKPKLHVRALRDEERELLKRMIRSRTLATRRVERAKIIWWASQGEPIAALIRRLGLSRPTIMDWMKRFNEAGLAGLEDLPRPGRPATYAPEQVAEVIATALSDPQTLHLPFASWTLDRLAEYLQSARGIAIKRSRIDEILLAEGLR